MPKYLDQETYHVYNRGAHRFPIFLCDENYYYCLRLLFKYATRYMVAVLGYCLMPNHFHLLLWQKTGGSISRFIQATFNAYSQAINKRTGHSGTLFQGKAKGLRVDSDHYALEVIRYIHLNPVAAGFVSDPADWEFSDYIQWISGMSDGLTDLSLRKEYFDSGKDYARFVSEVGSFTAEARSHASIQAMIRQHRRRSRAMT